MPKTRAQKETAVQELTAVLKAAQGMAFAKFEKHGVADDTELRRTARAAGVTVRVVKRSILARAAKAAGVAIETEAFSGTTALAASSDDAVAPAKLLHAFGVLHPGVALFAAVVDGAQVGPEDARRFALLPSVHDLRGQLASVIAGPLRGFVTVISGPMRGFLTALERRAESIPQS